MKEEIKETTNMTPEETCRPEDLLDENSLCYSYWVDEKGRIDDGAFAECYLKMHPMICIHGTLFTSDGIVSDESKIKNDIYSMIRPHVKSGLVRKTDQLLQTIKVEAYSEPLPLKMDRINVANGTLYLNGEFKAEKDYCLNRLPVNYNPDATKPERWLQFMDELFNPEDIGYIQFEKGKKISSTDFYKIYVSWCEANLEKARASASFLHYMKENQKKYGIIYDDKCIGNCRGFHNVCEVEFKTVVGKTPFD